MSNITFNFNAPIHIHVAPMMDSEDIHELFDLVPDIEDLICNAEEADHGKKCEDKPEQSSYPAPMAEGIPMILCFDGDVPEDFSHDEALAIAKDAILHILNQHTYEDSNNGKA